MDEPRVNHWNCTASNSPPRIRPLKSTCRSVYAAAPGLSVGIHPTSAESPKSERGIRVVAKGAFIQKCGVAEAQFPLGSSGKLGRHYVPEREPVPTSLRKVLQSPLAGNMGPTMLSMELKASNEVSAELYDWAEQGTDPTAQTIIAARATRVIDLTGAGALRPSHAALHTTRIKLQHSYLITITYKSSRKLIKSRMGNGFIGFGKIMAVGI